MVKSSSHSSIKGGFRKLPGERKKALRSFLKMQLDSGGTDQVREKESLVSDHNVEAKRQKLPSIWKMKETLLEQRCQKKCDIALR